MNKINNFKKAIFVDYGDLVGFMENNGVDNADDRLNSEVLGDNDPSLFRGDNTKEASEHLLIDGVDWIHEFAKAHDITEDIWVVFTD